MIPSERMQELSVAVSLGVDPKPQNDEERNHVRRVTADIEEIEDAGHVVMIPPEWEVET